MILLDTSVLVDLAKVTLPSEEIALSAVSYAELQFGITSAATPALRQERVRRLAWTHAIFGDDWLPFDARAAEGYAHVAAKVARTRPGHARSKDIMLAGHAHALGARLATLNPKDFALVADEVEIVVPPQRR